VFAWGAPSDERRGEPEGEPGEPAGQPAPPVESTLLVEHEESDADRDPPRLEPGEDQEVLVEHGGPEAGRAPPGENEGAERHNRRDC